MLIKTNPKKSLPTFPPSQSETLFKLPTRRRSKYVQQQLRIHRRCQRRRLPLLRRQEPLRTMTRLPNTRFQCFMLSHSMANQGATEDVRKGINNFFDNTVQPSAAKDREAGVVCCAWFFRNSYLRLDCIDGEGQHRLRVMPITLGRLPMRLRALGSATMRRRWGTLWRSSPRRMGESSGGTEGRRGGEHGVGFEG